MKNNFRFKIRDPETGEFKQYSPLVAIPKWIKDKIEEHSQKIAGTEQKIAEHESNIEENANTLTEHSQTISNHEERISALEHGGIGYDDTEIRDEIHALKGYFTEGESGGNLLNPSACVSGVLNLSNGTVTGTSYMTSDFIPVTAGKTYTAKWLYEYYGGGSRIPHYNADKAFTGVIVPNINSAKSIVAFTPTADGFVRLTLGVKTTSIAYYGTAMMVEGTEYPDTYIPYSDAVGTALSKSVKVLPESIDWFGEEIDKHGVLYGKKIVFDGDSICHATSESSTDIKRGWAYRIGAKNGMDWHNEGISGAVITDGLSSEKHTLSTYIETIHTKYPTLDYLILEGGTNDADIIGRGDAVRFGSMSVGDFSGTYDKNTFIGALETLFYKAITYYPKAKIGYIVAQKMGIYSNGSYVADNNSRWKFFKAAIAACEKWGIPYIDLWNGCYLNPTLQVYYDSSLTTAQNIANGKAYTDGQHLTAVGYDIISPKIEAWIKTL